MSAPKTGKALELQRAQAAEASGETPAARWREKFFVKGSRYGVHAPTAMTTYVARRLRSSIIEHDAVHAIVAFV